MIGPFDNTSRNGFGTTYSPENNKMLLDSVHLGKNGPVKWQPFSTSDRLGLMDLNQPFGHIKEVLCYAYTEFESSSEQTVQFRIGSKNAWKLWVNNRLIFARDEYHRGATRVDQFILDGRLQRGKIKFWSRYVKMNRLKVGPNNGNSASSDRRKRHRNKLFELKNENLNNGSPHSSKSLFIFADWLGF